MLLFITATAFDINQGVALTPPMVLYLLIFVTAAGVVVIAADPGGADVMHRPPRDPRVSITNRPAITLWAIYAVTLFLAALIPLVAGPDDPSTTTPTASLTMAFVVMGLGTVFNALTNRRDPASGLSPPLLRALAISLVPLTMIALATELPGLQQAAHRLAPPGRQWLACIGLAALLPLVVETVDGPAGGAPGAAVLDTQRALTPRRALERTG